MPAEGAECSRRGDEAVVAGALQLVLTVAQEDECSAWLACARFFDTLQAVGQWLLSPGGGGAHAPPAIFTD